MPRWERAPTPRPPIRPLPQMTYRPGALWVSRLRRCRLPGSSEALLGHYRYATMGDGTLKRPDQYELCPRYPKRAGALRVSPLGRERLPSCGTTRGPPSWRTAPMPGMAEAPTAGARSIRHLPRSDGAIRGTVGIAPLRCSHLPQPREQPRPMPLPAPMPAPNSRSGPSPRSKLAYDPPPAGYPQGNPYRRGIDRIPCGAPRVRHPGHPWSGSGAVIVAP
jgi:hypothetical protein